VVAKYRSAGAPVPALGSTDRAARAAATPIVVLSSSNEATTRWPRPLPEPSVAPTSARSTRPDGR
jgi:hypothetical protein